MEPCTRDGAHFRGAMTSVNWTSRTNDNKEQGFRQPGKEGLSMPGPYRPNDLCSETERTLYVHQRTEASKYLKPIFYTLEAF